MKERTVRGEVSSTTSEVLYRKHRENVLKKYEQLKGKLALLRLRCFAYPIAFGSTYHSRPNGSALEIRSAPR